jgi:regulator of sirC expression with transglutaminase-like and TPR domain
LTSEAFSAVFTGVVEYIFKNRALLSSMESSIADLIGSFHDISVLHKIAENFAKKRDHASAEKVYQRILEISPDDEKATRKRAYLMAIRDPDSVNEADLPPIELIEDNETLRSIETNYLMYKHAEGSSRPSSNPNT